MVVAYHLGGLLGAWVGIAGSVGTMAQSEMGGISGFLLRNHYPDFTIEVNARHKQLIFSDSRQKMPPKVARNMKCVFLIVSRPTRRERSSVMFGAESDHTSLSFGERCVDS